MTLAWRTSTCKQTRTWSRSATIALADVFLVDCDGTRWARRRRFSIESLVSRQLLHSTRLVNTAGARTTVDNTMMSALPCANGISCHTAI